MRSESFFNYFQHKSFSSRDIKQNIAHFEDTSAAQQQRLQNLRPFKTDFSSSSNLQVHPQVSQAATSSSSQQQQQSNGVKRKRSWSRAVFSNLQRKGLERQFEFQKYITKPDRKKLGNLIWWNLPETETWTLFSWNHNSFDLISCQTRS